MAYCTIEDIAGLTQLTISPASKPSTTEAQKAVDRIAGEIDGVLRAAGYTLPITNAGALNLLNQYNGFGAAAQVWHDAYPGEAEESANVKYWREEYRAFLKGLKDETQQLPGEEVAGEEDIGFAIAPSPRRDNYWLTGEEL